MKTASETLTPVVLELGGKDAAVICEDCDFDQAVNLCMRGTFQSCGQNCIGLERLIINYKIYDKFVDVLTPKIRSLTQGPPLSSSTVFDTGAMVMPSEGARLEGLIQDAVNKGAKLIVGGKQNHIKEWPLGQFFSPTLLIDVTPEMRIAQVFSFLFFTFFFFPFFFFFFFFFFF